jgi:hypothetical protein
MPADGNEHSNQNYLEYRTVAHSRGPIWILELGSDRFRDRMVVDRLDLTPTKTNAIGRRHDQLRTASRPILNLTIAVVICSQKDAPVNVSLGRLRTNSRSSVRNRPRSLIVCSIAWSAVRP